MVRLCCCLKKNPRTAPRPVSNVPDYENQLKAPGLAKDYKIQSIPNTIKTVNPPNSPGEGPVHSNTNENRQKNSSPKKKGFGFTDLASQYSPIPLESSRKELGF